MNKKKLNYPSSCGRCHCLPERNRRRCWTRYWRRSSWANGWAWCGLWLCCWALSSWQRRCTAGRKRVTKTQKLNHRFGDCSQQNANYLDTGYMVSEQFWILAPLKSSNLLIDSAIFFLVEPKIQSFPWKSGHGVQRTRLSPLFSTAKKQSTDEQSAPVKSFSLL